MKKVILVVFSIAANLFCLFSTSEKPVVAVLDFYSEVLPDDELASISSRLSSELLKTDQFTIVEISQRDSIIEEMAFALSGLADEDQAIEIGAMLSAQGLLMGTVAMVDNEYLVSAKLVETATGEILRSAENKFSDFDSLLGGLAPMAREIAGTSQLHSRRNRAYITMGGGAVLTGASLYFLINGGLKLAAVNDAWESYSTMTSGDFDQAYADYLSLHQEAQDSMANLQFIGGISGTVVGIGLIGVSAWMLLSPPQVENPFQDENPISVLVLPGEDSLTLAFGLSY